MKYNINFKIGKLTIVDYDKSKGCYIFKCECGTKVSGPSHYVDSRISRCLKNGNVGCRDCNKLIRLNNLSETDLYKPVYRKTKHSAKVRNKKFKLSLKQCIKLYKQDCHYCGKSPDNAHNTHLRIITYQGIDRMDPELGYTYDNCVPCCKTCNYAKHVLGYSEFLELVSKIHNRNVQRLC